MPINAKKVYDRVSQLAKTGTSGYQDEEEYNSKTYAAELAMTEMLFENYEINIKAAEALGWLITSTSVTTAANGIIPLPESYFHLLTLQYNGVGNKLYPSHKIRTNELGMVRTSPVRGMNVDKNKVGYYLTKDGYVSLPEQSGLNFSMLYIAKPLFSVATFAEASTEDSDFITFTGTDFGWPEQLFNMLVYLILEQLGIEMKEQLLTEYAAYGISRETIK